MGTHAVSVMIFIVNEVVSEQIMSQEILAEFISDNS